MQNSTIASPPHNASFRQQTPSISVEEALDPEDEHETETDTDTDTDTELQIGINGYMDYIMTPSPSAFLQAAVLEMVIPDHSLGPLELLHRPQMLIPYMIRLKKSQIQKLEEEVKCLEKVCEMAQKKKKKNGVSIN
ncbi:hypothetical protein TWF751_003076 [Orbilia oligospora]|nr:hypothetical protein TWF751_003076 [Orbilia oligospora]